MQVLLHATSPSVKLTVNSFGNSNNFIASLLFNKEIVGFAVLDQSTGEFYMGESNEKNIPDALRQFSPKEILISDSQNYITSSWYKMFKPFISQVENWVFDFDHGYRMLTDHFKTPNLKSYGCENFKLGISAAGALMYQLKQNFVGYQLLKKIVKYSKLNFEN